MIIFYKAYNDVVEGQLPSSQQPQASPIYVQVAAPGNNDNAGTNDIFESKKSHVLAVIGTMILNILFSVLCVVYLSIGLGRCKH